MKNSILSLLALLISSVAYAGIPSVAIKDGRRVGYLTSIKDRAGDKLIQVDKPSAKTIKVLKNGLKRNGIHVVDPKETDYGLSIRTTPVRTTCEERNAFAPSRKTWCLTGELTTQIALYKNGDFLDGISGVDLEKEEILDGVLEMLSRY